MNSSSKKKTPLEHFLIETMQRLVNYVVDDLQDSKFFQEPFRASPQVPITPLVADKPSYRYENGNLVQAFLELCPTFFNLYSFLLNNAPVNHGGKNAYTGNTTLHQICLIDDPKTCPMLQEFLSSGQASNFAWLQNSSYNDLE